MQESQQVCLGIGARFYGEFKCSMQVSEYNNQQEGNGTIQIVPAG